MDIMAPNKLMSLILSPNAKMEIPIMTISLMIPVMENVKTEVSCTTLYSNKTSRKVCTPPNKQIPKQVNPDDQLAKNGEWIIIKGPSNIIERTNRLTAIIGARSIMVRNGP